MLPLKNRLTKKDEIIQTRRLGKKYGGVSFDAAIMRSEDKDLPRFGFVVSSKVGDKATLRNRAKRILREAVRNYLSFIKPGQNVVIVGKKPLLNRTSAQVKTEIKEMFLKLQLFKDEKDCP